MRKKDTGLGLKSIVARTALILGVVAALCFAIATWLIQQKAAALQEAAAISELEELAKAEAAKVGGSAGETLAQVRGLADATTNIMAHQGSREEASSLARNFTVSDASALGYWLEFAPNGFDGKDAEFARSWPNGEPDEAGLTAFSDTLTASQKACTDSGRVSIYWHSDGPGKVSLQNSIGSASDLKTDGPDAMPYYVAVQQRDGEMMFEPYSDDVSGKQVLMTSLMVPIKVNGEFKGVAGADITLDAIQASLAKVRPYGNGIARLLSPTGMVLAAPEKELLGKPWNQDIKNVTAALAKGKTVYVRDQGTLIKGEVLRVYAPVKIGRSADTFILMVTAPMDAVMAGVVEIRNRVIMVGVLTVLALVAVVIVLLRTMIGSPLKGIVQGVDAVAAGQLDYPIAAGGEDEVGLVSKALRTMQTDLKARLESEHKIAAENLRVRTALDYISTGVYLTNPQLDIVFANQALKDSLERYGSDFKATLPHFDGNKPLVGQPVSVLEPNQKMDAALIQRLEQNGSAQRQMQFGNAQFAQNIATIRDDQGQPVGRVVEWRDRTGEVKTEQEVAKVLASAANGDLNQRIDKNGKEGFFLTLADQLNTLLQTNAATMADVQRALTAMADGDLTQRITANYSGVFGNMRDATNTTAERLTETLQRVQTAVDAIRTAAREIAAGNSDLSARSEQQAASLEETAASMEELTSTVKNNAESSNQARQVTTGAADVAARGGKVVEQVVEQMTGITSASKQIENIIGVIDSIAFQTNILALNAAVEAARAGEQGRGFAVVAGEVRALAQRSAGAAKEIKDLISDSVERVDQGAALVNDAGNTMREIVAAISRVNDLMAEISAASQEQSAGIEQVNQTITHMDGVTQQNAAMVEEASAAAHSLQEQADDLADAVAVFKMQ